MKYVKSILSLCACMALVTAGCDSGSPLTDYPGDETAAAHTGDNAAKVGDAPSESGLRVVRTEEGFGYLAVDQEAGLVAVFGLSATSFAEFWCGTGELEFDDTNTMRITNPQNEEWQHLLRQGSVQATVWPFSHLTCANLSRFDPIATGMVSVQQVDNDEAGEAFFDPDANHTNAWSFLMHGLLNDGADAFHFGQQCRGNAARGTRCNTKMRLNGFSPFAFNEANGHFYRVIDVDVPWWLADLIASDQELESCSGHLATLTSAEENEFVANAFPRATEYGYWLGGYQDPAGAEPSDGWAWVTGEPWGYTNWAAGEPNDLGGEDHLHFSPPVFGNPVPGAWNDMNENNVFGAIPGGFVVEFDC